ncbi:glycosyltransferase family 2 protein [Variovorax paradoxus]|uniref:glycosyltransferase family 2 protein n=1 Tax=Variovorax paradoxus TaxID=34073 RepID=UPI002789797C|nr:glycosyltransferase family 2 protein [Variovorax paradoxus]MDP9933171.1 glycosyltransferase involved in cell wall biosynthesis [Variovorax paradoxus]
MSNSTIAETMAQIRPPLGSTAGPPVRGDNPSGTAVAEPVGRSASNATLHRVAVSAAATEPQVELTILMPCLNEALTLPTCIGKARAFLALTGIHGEVLVADNGSVDGSQALASACGARVIDVPVRGYGAALIAGIDAAAGRYVIMGDADESYDFGGLAPFVAELRQGSQLVMGNRFRGGILPSAMPPLHRYLGNPVLSFVGRLFFKSKIGDFHCGLRGFERQAIQHLELCCEGMEFASEMVVKASLSGLRIVEVPTVLSPDGRDRPPHLRTWRDGWRHLRFLLLFTPRWLFLYPGMVLTLLSLAQLLLAHFHPDNLGRWPVGIHTQLFASAGMVLGYQTMLFAMGAVLARHCARLNTPHPRERWALRAASGGWLSIGGILATLFGLAMCASLTWQWGRTGFGALNPENAMRQIIPGVALLLMGTQSLLASVFFAALRSAFDLRRGDMRTNVAGGRGGASTL